MTSSALDRTVADQPDFHIVTRSGVRLRLRSIDASDGTELNKLLGSLRSEDLRFRFLVSQNEPNAADIGRLLMVDHRRTEHVLAIDEQTSQPVASLMIAADPEMRTAEVAIAVASGARNRGIGWALLRHAADLARARGIKTLRSIESRANLDALVVERTLGFRCSTVEGDPALVMVEADLA
jgi:acetyltransferase